MVGTGGPRKNTTGVELQERGRYLDGRRMGDEGMELKVDLESWKRGPGWRELPGWMYLELGRELGLKGG